MATKMKVSTPVEGYTGVIAGVSFVDGDAETDNQAAISYFRRAGYTVDEPKARKAAPKKAPAKTSDAGEKTPAPVDSAENTEGTPDTDNPSADSGEPPAKVK